MLYLHHQHYNHEAWLFCKLHKGRDWVCFVDCHILSTRQHSTWRRHLKHISWVQVSAFFWAGCCPLESDISYLFLYPLFCYQSTTPVLDLIQSASDMGGKSNWEVPPPPARAADEFQQMCVSAEGATIQYPGAQWYWQCFYSCLLAALAMWPKCLMTFSPSTFTMISGGT